jgi:hypothetical protein
LQVQPQNQPWNDHPVYSSNDPPPHYHYTNDGQHVDARTHILDK